MKMRVSTAQPRSERSPTSRRRNSKSSVSSKPHQSSVGQLFSRAGNRAAQRLVNESANGTQERFNIPGVRLPNSGGGEALPEPVMNEMSQALGADFSGVRVHEGPEAEAVNSHAYTQGEDVHFKPGNYDPNSQSGKEMIGHELVHVMQQRAGRVASPGGDGAPINAEKSLESEAERVGKSAARSTSSISERRSAGSSQAGDSVQRQAMDEEELLEG